MVIPQNFDLTKRLFNLSEMILVVSAHHSCEPTFIRNEICRLFPLSLAALSRYENKMVGDRTTMSRKRANQFEHYFTQKMGKKMSLIEREAEDSLFAEVAKV